MRDKTTKFCPFCKGQINESAVKCRYCQSSFLQDSASKTEKLAELVIKSVGFLPLTMTILLAMAGMYGIKTVSDVHSFKEQAEKAAEKMESKLEIIDNPTQYTMESKIETLLNDLSVDSDSSKARSTRKDLQDLYELVEPKDKTTAKVSINKTIVSMLEGLFSYYDGKYDEAEKALMQADDKSANKFRLLGIVIVKKAEIEQKKNNDSGAKKLYDEAYKYFMEAERLSKEDNQLLAKNRANRAVVAGELGKFEESEKIFVKLIRNDPRHLLYYYNIARTYSRWGKLDQALESLEKGVEFGLVRDNELTKQNLDEDLGFKNLRMSEDDKIKARYAKLLKETSTIEPD